MRDGMGLKIDDSLHRADLIAGKRLACLVFLPVRMASAKQCLDPLFVRQRFQRLRLSRVLRVQPPVMPVRPDNPAAEEDGDRDAVCLDHRREAIIASMAVVEGDDEGLPGEPRDRLARARGQTVRERYHVVTGWTRGRL